MEEERKECNIHCDLEQLLHQKKTSFHFAFLRLPPSFRVKYAVVFGLVSLLLLLLIIFLLIRTGRGTQSIATTEKNKSVDERLQSKGHVSASLSPESPSESGGKGLVDRSEESKVSWIGYNFTRYPGETFPLGHQNDGVAALYVAVMNTTRYGLIPGKADKNRHCWYTVQRVSKNTLISRREHCRYVAFTRLPSLERNLDGPPSNAHPLRQWKEGVPHYFPVVAHTPWGTIPGKADNESMCTYEYGDRERTTHNFSWIVTTM